MEGLPPENLSQGVAARWLLLFALAWALFFATYHTFEPPERDPDKVVDSAGTLSETSPLHRFSALLLATCGMVPLVRRRHRMAVRGPLGWLVVGFIALTAVSVLWADDRMLTIKREFSFLAIALAALAAADRLSMRDLLLLALFGTGAILLLGIGVELRNGAFHPGSAGYRFAGTVHPNSQGANCAVLFLTSVALAGNRRRSNWIFYSVAVVAMGFLVLTGSRTAFLGVLLVVLVFSMLQRTPLQVFGLACAVIVVATTLALMVDTPSLARGILLNREEMDSVGSFTGRVPLWGDLWTFVMQRPVLGYGYNAFWTPEHIIAVSRSQDWVIFSAHSGYMEMALSVGVLGVAAFAVILVAGAVARIRRYLRYRDRGDAFAAAAIILCTLEMMFESTFNDPGILPFLCMTSIAGAALVQEPERGVK
jgi:exopolysaccharide production protein ExoQ